MERKIKKILEYISQKETEYGRKIYLVGASKTRTAEEINQAVSFGLKMVGENKPQEFRDKFPFISKDCEAHFIGHLQKNKIKYVVGKAKLIHSCDCLDLADAMDEYADRIGVVQDVLVEINIAGEVDKHGFAPSEILQAAQSLKTLKNLRFRGVMTVLPRAEEQILAQCCEKMREIYSLLKPEFGEDFIYLSMGMSEDYRIAIEHGSNMIRLGRAIFGERNY